MVNKSKRGNKASHTSILAGASRCIYCPTKAVTSKLTIEHMPPRGMFRKKDRPKGFEFASCANCNEGTSAADSAVAFFARIDQLGGDVLDWKVQESVKYLKSANDGAPGFVNEILGDQNARDAFLRTPGGVLIDVVETHTGPISQALLHVFGAKLGMAMFHEHIGKPLPLAGGVHTMWFLNSGLSEETANGILNILPGLMTINMGQKSASGQFDYRYNSDEKTIVASLAHFHSNIHFFTIAMEDPDKFRFPRPMPFAAFIRPGELLQNMPRRRSETLLPRLGQNQFPSLLLPNRTPQIHNSTLTGSPVLSWRPG